MNAASLRRTAWIIASVLAAAFAIHASEGRAGAEAQGGMAEELLLLKEETVSIAARHEQPMSEAPSNVYVLTDEDIRQSGATDLPTVLRRVPGLEVIQMSGAQFDVSARGDNQPLANKMLVLVDGRSIYEDIGGNVFWKAIPVTLPEIKRIEVLKGPASSLYGFNAFDGVINIITKTPEEMKGTTLQFGGGEFGTIMASAIQAGTYDKFGYRLSVGRDQNNEWRNRGALAFRSDKFNIQTEYATGIDSKLLVSGGLVDVNRFDGPIIVVDSNALRFTQGYANIGYERPNFFIRTYWNRFDADDLIAFKPGFTNFLQSTSPDGNPHSLLIVDSYNVETQYALELARGNRLTSGINFRLNTLTGNSLDSSGVHENRLGFYLQDEWTPIEKLSIVLGIRHDLDTNIKPVFSPHAALIYAFAKDHTVRAGVSVAYRPPTLFEVHENLRTTVTLPPPIPSPPPITAVGNKNLRPEKIVSYEAGYQGWFLRHRLRARADLYFNHLTDLINNEDVSPTLNTPINASGTADIYGGEAGIEFLVTSWLTGFGNYSYEEIGQSFTGLNQRGAPRFKANVGLRIERENGWSGEAVLHHVGAATYPISGAFFSFVPFGVVPPDPRVGSYNLLNLRGAYRFWHEKAEVAVSVFNALNDQHKEHPLGDTISSRVMGWLTIRF